MDHWIGVLTEAHLQHQDLKLEGRLIPLALAVNPLDPTWEVNRLNQETLERRQEEMRVMTNMEGTNM